MTYDMVIFHPLCQLVDPIEPHFQIDEILSVQDSFVALTQSGCRSNSSSEAGRPPAPRARLGGSQRLRRHLRASHPPNRRPCHLPGWWSGPTRGVPHPPPHDAGCLPRRLTPLRSPYTTGNGTPGGVLLGGAHTCSPPAGGQNFTRRPPWRPAATARHCPLCRCPALVCGFLPFPVAAGLFVIQPPPAAHVLRRPPPRSPFRQMGPRWDWGRPTKTAPQCPGS